MCVEHFDAAVIALQSNIFDTIAIYVQLKLASITYSPVITTPNGVDS